MARMIFYPAAGATGSLVRIDTASGSNTPADITPVDRQNVSIRDSVLQAGHVTGKVQSFMGPNGVTTLYEKQLNYAGTVTGAIATLTGVAQETPGLSSSGSGSTPYGLAIGRGNVNIPVGGATAFFGSIVSNGLDTSSMARVFIPVSDPLNRVLLPVFNNQPNVANVAGDGAIAPNPIIVAAGLEMADGTEIPYSFNGAARVTIPPGGTLAVADFPLAHGGLVADAQWPGVLGVYFRTYVTTPLPGRTESVTTTSGSPTVTDASMTTADIGRLITGTGIPANAYIGPSSTNGSIVLSSSPVTQASINATASGTVTATIKSIWPLLYGVPSFSNKTAGSSNGADLTLLGSAGGSSGFTTNQNSYGPCLVLGEQTTTRKPIGLSMADSIFHGTTDQLTGPVARAAINLGYPHVKISKVGEYASGITTPAGRRFRSVLVAGCTHCVLELGTNDGVPSISAATSLQASLVTDLAWLASQGIKTWVCTVPPKGTSSTDGYATPGGQTPYNTAAGLAQINAFIRTNTVNQAGFIEINTPLSTAQDSGLWAASPFGRQVTDAAVLSGVPVIYSATAAFTSNDIGLNVFISSIYSGAQAITVVGSPTGAPAWTATAAQALGIFARPVVANGNLYVATTAGTTGSSEPTWPTSALGTVTDGSVVWTNLGAVTGAKIGTTNSGSTATARTLGIGALWSTGDGTHPSTSMMTGALYAAVQGVMATWSYS